MVSDGVDGKRILTFICYSLLFVSPVIRYHKRIQRHFDTLAMRGQAERQRIRRPQAANAAF
jgi:hypothetical protein